MSKCDDALGHVDGYLDREVNRYQVWRIHRHLRKCEGCDRAYVFEERLRVVVRECLHEEVPPAFLERLRRALHSAR